MDKRLDFLLGATVVLSVLNFLGIIVLFPLQWILFGAGWIALAGVSYLTYSQYDKKSYLLKIFIKLTSELIFFYSLVQLYTALPLSLNDFVVTSIFLLPMHRVLDLALYIKYRPPAFLSTLFLYLVSSFFAALIFLGFLLVDKDICEVVPVASESLGYVTRQETWQWSTCHGSFASGTKTYRVEDLKLLQRYQLLDSSN